ncbi:hypothetical protein PWT90_08265 [Aphanocladium album]|nr:hypothetical protein PWT90_08265 [Aphanocladium album]
MDDSEDGSQRRIELASPKDFAFLIANVRAAAAQHLHAAIPHAADNDDLRDDVEAIVDDYIDRTFTLAAPNLSINGMPVNPTDFVKPPAASSSSSSRSGRKSSIPPIPDDTAYEPFDADKRQQVADLVSQEEALLEQVAAMKRAVPADVAAAVAAQLEGAAQRDEVQMQRAKELRARRRGGGEAGMEVLPPLARQDGVEESFRLAVGTLEALKNDMPSVVAKMERARVAGEYVRDER